MKIVMATDSQLQSPRAMGSKHALFSDLRVVTLLVISFAVLNLFWFSFDHHFPTQDEAEHIMNSIAAKDLLRHFHPWSYHWWYQILTINCFYPPVAYIVNGFFMLIFGQSRLTEQISLTFFLCLAVGAIYGIVRLLKGSRLCAVSSACCLAMYPLITMLSHSFFLDLPEVAMTALSLLVLLWWQRQATPQWKYTILTAVVLGISCLTKQLVAAFLIPVGLYFLIDYTDLVHTFKNPRSPWLYHLFAMGIVIAAIGFPFIFINYKSTHEMMALLMNDFALKKVQWSYIDRLQLYLPLVIKVMSVWLCALFVNAIVFVKRAQQLRLLPLTISAIGGLSLVLLWPGNAVDPRYLAPALIFPAIYTGFLLDEFFSSDNLAQRIIAIVFSCITIMQSLYSNFIPFPSNLPELPPSLASETAQNNPVPLADWGHDLVIDTIRKDNGPQPVYLNVLINMGTLHTHAFELLLKEKGINTIIPTTSRAFTLFGDKVEFTQEEALRYPWYLRKTGSLGYPFFDKQSQNNFNKLVDFINNSGNYKLIIQKNLPDGSQLMLYKKH